MLAMFLHGVVLVQLGHPETGATHVGDIDVELVPPGPAVGVVLEAEIAVAGGRVQGGGGNGAGVELQAENGVGGVIDEGPGGIAQGFVVGDAEETDELV